MPHDVVAIGTVNIDMIVIGDAPRDINALNEWVDLSRVEIMPAGSMGYCAVDMARLGLKVTALSSVGGDLFGEWIVRRLGSEGVDSSGIVIEKDKITGIAIYILLFGSRKRPLTGRLGTHAPWPAKLTAAQAEMLRRARLLHCGGYLHYSDMWGDPTVSLFRNARQSGLKTALDTQFPMSPVEPPWMPCFGELLQYVDIIFTDEAESKSITGEPDAEAAARVLLSCGPELVVVKQGEQGALLATKDCVIRQPSFPPDLFEDSIGAGDAFDAGVIYGVLKDWDIGRTAQFAAMTASCTLRGVGGITAAPTVDEVMRLLESVS